MTRVEITPVVEIGGEMKEEIRRSDFLGSYTRFINELQKSEEEGHIDQIDLSQFLLAISDSELPDDEKALFSNVYNLFSLKHGIGALQGIPNATEFVRGKGMNEFTVEIGGPIGVGKTTFAKALSKELGAKEEDEQFVENPFWEKSIADPSYMLRSQLKFLADNITAGINGKFKDGRWVRDTSVWSDIFVFMEWRRMTGKVTDSEYEVYMKTVDLLLPLIPIPDLLIMMHPTSEEALLTGLTDRIIGEQGGRDVERAIDPMDIHAVCEAAEEASRLLTERYGINVIDRYVDPREMYGKSEVRYAEMYLVRGELGILHELLTKDPREVASEIATILAEAEEAQLIFVHSKSMFAGKTSTMNAVVDMLRLSNKALIFQPRAGIRYGEAHETHMIDRDGRQDPAVTVESNRLEEIVTYVQDLVINGKIDGGKYILIDEIQLFVGTNKDDAVSILQRLQQFGLHILCNGIDYTFQEEPFTFSHEILNESLMNTSWHEVQLGTRCKYCPNEAEGTRRITSSGQTASYSDQAFQAGENYEPVCCRNGHVSCTLQPEGFKRRPLPLAVFRTRYIPE